MAPSVSEEYLEGMSENKNMFNCKNVQYIKLQYNQITLYTIS